MSRQLALEIEGLLRIHQRDDKASNSTNIWQSILVKKGKYKELTSEIFHPLPDVDAKEKKQLIDIFTNTSGYSWRRTSGWRGLDKCFLPFEAPVPYFDGIFTQITSMGLSQVIEINLQGVGCSGDIAHIPLSFPALTNLNLSKNRITGNTCIDLSSLPCLQKLNLSCNDLSFDISNLSFINNHSLISIDLSFNRIYGQIPASLFISSQYLVSLNLMHNSIHGSLPNLSHACSLKQLNLSSNLFEGNILTEYSSLIFLSQLILSNNKLSGNLDTCYCLTSLDTLCIDNNALSGTIKNDISQLYSLQILHLQNNSLQGWIPDTISSLVALRLLDLSNNNIEFTLPINIGNLANLQVLRLTENYISGPLPESISQLTALKQFHVFDSYSSESTSASYQFDKLKFQYMCGLHKEIGIDSFSCSAYDLYGVEDDKETREAEAKWMRKYALTDSESH